MREILDHIFNGGRLERRDAEQLMVQVARGECPPVQVAALLSAYRMRHLSIAELEGFRDGLFSLAKQVNLDADDAVDVCGTGGDGKSSYNVSTAVAFVVAGAGIRVAKHGNHGVSSMCGSSTVLEQLGVKFSDQSDVLRRQLDRAGVCFLHAPLFHPLLKNVAPVRRELGVKTFLNILGPLLNPASVSAQLLGVYNLELGRLLRYYFQQRGKQVTIVHSTDGFDEVSLSAPTHALSNERERILEARDFGFERLAPDALCSKGGPEQNARALLDLLTGKGDAAYRAVVIANSALAIQLRRSHLSLADAVAQATESIDSGKAGKSFELVREG